MEKMNCYKDFIRLLKEKNLYRKDYYKEFLRFLKNNNICENFFANFNSSNGVDYRLVRTNKTSLVDFIEYCNNLNEFNVFRKSHNLSQIVICFGFIWRDTEEGQEFWNTIYNLK